MMPAYVRDRNRIVRVNPSPEKEFPDTSTKPHARAE